LLSLFYGELAPRRTPLASKWPAHLSHLPCHEIRLFRWTQQHNAFRREQAHGAKAQASLRTPGSRGWSVPHPDLRSDTPLECGSLLSLFYGELAPRCVPLGFEMAGTPNPSPVPRDPAPPVRVHGGTDFTHLHEPLDSGVQRRMAGRTPEFGLSPWPPTALLHAHENSRGSASRGTTPSL